MHVMNETPEDAARSIPTHEQLAGRQLRLLRQGRGWSQLEVAEKMRAYGYQWSQATVTRLEAASRPIRLNELVDIAALYGVPVTLFLESEVPDDPDTLKREIKTLSDERKDLWFRRKEAVAALDKAQAVVAALNADIARIEGRIEYLMRWRPPVDKSGDSR